MFWIQVLTVIVGTLILMMETTQIINVLEQRYKKHEWKDRIKESDPQPLVLT